MHSLTLRLPSPALNEAEEAAVAEDNINLIVSVSAYSIGEGWGRPLVKAKFPTSRNNLRGN